MSIRIFFGGAIKYAMMLCLLIVLFKIFWPRMYAVPPFQKKAGTQYWNLSTGSKIGYTFIPAKGQRKSFPVIYLHGGPGGAVSDKTIKTLSVLANDGYDVYLYDQIGSGQSERLKDISSYTVERHINDLKEIIHKTRAEKVIFIAQSWGAILAVLFATGNVDQVEKIIFTSSGPVYPIHRELSNTHPPDSLLLRNPFYSNKQGNEKANNIRTKAMQFFATKFNIKIASDKEADDFATYLNSELDKSTVCDTAQLLKSVAGSGFYAGIMTFNSLRQVPDPRPKISNSIIPILVMKGECDNQPWGFTNEYLQLFKNHQLAIIPAAGHAISLEQPELYIKTIKEYLDK